VIDVKLQRSLLAAALLAALPFLPEAVLLAADPEPAPTLKAAELLPKELLSGSLHKVGESAPIEEYMPRFTITSSFGNYAAEGREMLEVRIREIAALAALSEISKGEAFAKAMKASAEKKAKAIGTVVSKPGETASAAAKGAGRFMKKSFGKAKDATAEAVKDDTPEAEAKSADASADTAEKAKDLAGVSKARRAWAKQAGVDPYTTNPALSKKLDDLAWASYAGGFALAIATPPVPGLSLATAANKLAWELPPEDLAKANDQKLQKLGVKEATRKAFLAARAFSPVQQTGFVTALEALQGVAGIDEAVALAVRLAESEQDARFFRRNAEILARGHKGGEPLAAIELRPALFAARARSGALLVPVPVDYLHLTEVVSDFVATSDPKGARREARLSGVASTKVREQLVAAKIGLRERVLDEPAK